MDMFVANATRQVWRFMFRLPENKQEFSQTIGVGMQEKVISPPAGLSTADIASIIEQYSVYGMIPVDEIGKVKGFIGKGRLRRAGKNHSKEKG